MTTLESMRDVNQTVWTNTVTTFKRQYTMLNTLIAEVKQLTNDMVDPKKKVDGKAAKMKVDPIKQKLELLNKYVDSLHNILPSAAVIDEGTWGVTNLNLILSKCMDDAQTGHDELLGLLEAINVWESHQKKDSKDTKTGVTGGDSSSAKPSEIKGVATSLKPEELTTSIAAYNMSYAAIEVVNSSGFREVATPFISEGLVLLPSPPVTPVLVSLESFF